MNYVYLATSLGINGFVQGDEFRAHCPFHQDRTPSFSLNIHSGLGICHKGCWQGNFYDLIERVLNCTPLEAQEWIRSFGDKKPIEQLSKQLAVELNLVPQVNPEEVHNGWLERFKRLDSVVMPIWFHQRGFTWETIRKWDIRYDPIQDAIVIPVIKEGELIGTIARRYRFEPKYLNSEFPKREILFGLNHISRSERLIIVVEGPLDCIWVNQCGLGAVALLGARMGQPQAALLKQKFGEVILALDNDEAGKIGTKEAIKLLTSKGYLLPQIKILEYPKPCKDANDCTSEELHIAFENRQDVFLNDLLKTY